MTPGFAISSDQGTGSVAVTKPMQWTQQQMVRGVSATKNWPQPLQGTGEASRGYLMGGGTAQARGLVCGDGGAAWLHVAYRGEVCAGRGGDAHGDRTQGFLGLQEEVQSGFY